MSRLDLALVELGLAPTRSKAQQLIEAGDVEVFVRGEWKVIEQSSHAVAQVSLQFVRVRENNEVLKYVSRGGLKLEGALEHLSLDVRGWRCLDLGISTGGFTDCLLRAGAKEVCGIDVGHQQLHASLVGEARLLALEGVHIKDASDNLEVQRWLANGVNLCVADLSFISLISVFKTISALLPTGTRFLALIKPQFEVGAAQLGKGGLVKETSIFTEVELRAKAALRDADFEVADFFASRLKGQDGNQEFFVYARRI